MRHDPRRREADPRVDGAVRGRRRLHRVLELQVVGDDHARDRPLGASDPHRPVDQVPDLGGGARRLHVLAGDVLEEGLQVDLLLVAAPDRRTRLLPDDRDDRLMVELRVIEAVEQMDRAGTEVARQTPTSPVNLACPHAMNAAISSWRTCMNSSESFARSSAPTMPLMPSPG